MKRTVLTYATLLPNGQALADGCTNVNTRIKMSTCVAEQYKTANARFNETYQNVLKCTVPTRHNLLKKAQISWITLYDADCALISSDAKGDSVQAMISNQCPTGKTNECKAFPASLLQCEESGLSYPLPPAS